MCLQGYTERVSHLDDLDEFEAELELALKRLGERLSTDDDTP